MWPFTSPSTTTNQDPPPPSACPVDHDTRQEWLQQSQSQSSTPPPPTRPELGTHRLSEQREVSTIPRWLPESNNPTASTSNSSSEPPSACPAHDPSFQSSTNTTSTPPLNSAEQAAIIPSESNWVYPSPSSFYRALSAKNRNPNPQDMDIVVPIHNAVNERVWQQVLEWERHALGLKEGEDTGVKLVSFMGRPKEMSPRARWKSFIGYTAPFDRHDWIIDRPTPSSSSSSSPTPESTRVRYVIDFYTGRGANLLSQQLPPPQNSKEAEQDRQMRETPMPNLAFYIDCRPALDGWEGVRMRFRKYWGIEQERD
ncbi:hypothetical protein JCM5353_007219 [Sporobolomyces roseus]